MTRLLSAVAAALVFAPVSAAAPEPELLEPEQAYAFSARATGPDTIEAGWKVADGYYMYRDKIRFEVVGEGVALKPVTLPAGKRKKDEFFGEVEIYTKAVKTTLTLTRAAGGAQTIKLRAYSQGCNEPVGVCYSPLTQEVSIQLAAAPATTAPAPPAKSGEINSLSSLSRLLEPNKAQSEFLDPDQAFALDVRPLDERTLLARIRIAPGYYLYRDKTKFEATGPTRLAAYTLPKGKEKHDEFFGKTEVYYDAVEVRLPLAGAATASARVELNASYQGCADKGICYPPISKKITLDLAGAAPAATAPPAAAPAATTPAPASRAPAQSEEERVRALFSDRSIWITIGLFFVLGLGLALTPCVFPMIPILSGIIVGQGEGISHRKSFGLSVAYVLGMAITYSLAGVLAGMTGELLSSAFQDPWILGLFSLVFVLLALSMFGFYNLQLPASLQGRLSAATNRFRGGALIPVFGMGALSALIVGPCVAAPLSGALLYIGQTGDVVLGGGALFAMSLGMGAPLLAIGASAGTLLPRAGVWMDAVKAVFGVLLLAVAVWMISRVIPAEIALVLWAALLIVPAMYLRALDALPHDASGWARLWKGFGLVMLLYGVMLFIGAFTGASDPLDPLSGVRGLAGGARATAADSGAGMRFEPAKGAALNARLASAAAAGKPVMVDFYADWCVECVRMENTTFKDPAVVKALSGYVLLRADVTQNDAADKALLKQFNLFGPPAILFFGADGKERRAQRIVGYMDAPKFQQNLAQAAGPN